MRWLILSVLFQYSLQAYSSVEKCEIVEKLVNNATEAMSLLRLKKFSPVVKESLKKVIDNGTLIDRGFFEGIKSGVAYSTKVFNMKIKKKGYKNSLEYHFKKHGHELNPPATSEKNYLKRARAFSAEINADIISVNMKGTKVRFNVKTKEFITIDKNGIGTYYIANLSYINKNSKNTYSSAEQWFYHEKWRDEVLGISP